MRERVLRKRWYLILIGISLLVAAGLVTLRAYLPASRSLSVKTDVSANKPDIKIGDEFFLSEPTEVVIKNPDSPLSGQTCVAIRLGEPVKVVSYNPDFYHDNQILVRIKGGADFHHHPDNYCSFDVLTFFSPEKVWKLMQTSKEPVETMRARLAAERAEKNRIRDMLEVEKELGFNVSR